MWTRSIAPILLASAASLSCTSTKNTTMQSPKHTEALPAPLAADALLRVDELAADEGLSYWLRLRASDSCQVWTEEGSDGANSILRRCERCEEPEWGGAWLEKLAPLRTQVSWTDDSVAYDAAYSAAVDADQEQRVTLVLDDGTTKLRPRDVADYQQVLKSALALWQEARPRMPDWNTDCKVISSDEL